MSDIYNDEKIKRLGQEIRRMWVEEMRFFHLRTEGVDHRWGSKHMARWDGGTDKNSRTHKPVWPQIAKFCTDNQINPALMVRAMFYSAPKGLPPQPNQCKGAFALARYEKYTGFESQLELKTSLMYKFEAQKALALGNVHRLKDYNGHDDDTAWRLTITSKHDPFTPLFRYCVAMNQGWDDLAVLYADDARYQYTRDAEVYNEVWGEWIPEELKKGAGYAELPNTTA
jgi:hypothetical protein